jgi:hypothetical protein
MARMGIREYARHRRCGHASVLRAIASRRLDGSVGYEAGKPFIADHELADREWVANTDHSRAPGYVKERDASVSAPPSLPLSSSPSVDELGEADVPDGTPNAARPSLSEASAREKHFKAQLAELEYRRQTGELVNAREVAERWVDLVARARTRLLAVPRKAKQLLAHLSYSDVSTLDALIREALEELAHGTEKDNERGAE